MQIGLLLAALMSAASAPAKAGDCDRIEDVRSRAECLHGAMAPDVILRLYDLAVSSLRGKTFVDEGVHSDFLYVAEEAGEAARRNGLEPIIRLATAQDLNSAVFGSRAITTFLDAVRYGFSHTHSFRDGGDKKLLAESRDKLSAPCKRLASHRHPFVREEGLRCLSDIQDRDALVKLLGRPGALDPKSLDLYSAPPAGSGLP